MAARQNSGCTQIVLAVLGLVGVVLTGVFAIGAAVIGREDIPLPFINRPAVEQPIAPASNVAPNNAPASSSSSNTNTNEPSTSGPVRYQVYLQGFIVDNVSGASAAYEMDLTAEGNSAENRSVFTGDTVTSLYDNAGTLYTRETEVKGEFNSGVLSYNDANVIYEDFLPGGLSWCVLSATAYAQNPQGTEFVGIYSSANPPCSGTISLQVMSQNPLP